MFRHHRRESVLGALIALALDVPLLLASLLLTSAVPALIWFDLAATAGLIVAPIVGWRNGPSAIAEREGWASQAVAEAAVAAYGLWVVYILGSVVIFGPPGGPGNLLPFLVFALVEGAFYGCVPVLVAAMPFGFVWRRLLRAAIGRSTVRVGHDL